MAAGFAVLGGALIAGGIVLGDAMEGAAGTAALYLAGAVLLAIGPRSVTYGLRGGGAPAAMTLTTRKIAITALAVAIDKLAVGLSFAVLDAPLGLMNGELDLLGPQRGDGHELADDVDLVRDQIRNPGILACRSPGMPLAPA